MIQAGTGLARGNDPDRCAQAASRAAMSRLASSGSKHADAVMVFTSGHDPAAHARMLRSVRKICGTGHLAGCSGAGVLTDAGEIEGESGVAVLALASDALKITPFFVKDLKGRDQEAGREIGRIIQPFAADNALVVLFPDTLSCNPDLLFAGLHEIAGPVSVAGGGAACGSASGDATYQFCGGEAVNNAVSGMVLSGAIDCSVGVTQSCLPVGRPRRVTASLGNAIKSLDDAPAVRALLESLAGPGREISEDVHRLARHLFVAFPSGPGRDLKRGQYIVRNILGVDPDDGSIYVGCETPVGETICFALRDPDGARDDLKAMLEESAPSVPHLGGPGLGLYFNCCARGEGLYGLPDIDTAYIRNTYVDMPLAGFFGFAEIAPGSGRARLHNYAGVMVLVSETSVARPS